jgi:hypothetical protein
MLAPQRRHVCPSRCRAAARARSQEAFRLSAMRGLGLGGWAAHGLGRPQWQSRIAIGDLLSAPPTEEARDLSRQDAERRRMRVPPCLDYAQHVGRLGRRKEGRSLWSAAVRISKAYAYAADGLATTRTARQDRAAAHALRP